MRRKIETTLLLGKICMSAIHLNKQDDITVYLCYHGNTNCINVTVEEKRSEVYKRREFSHNEQGLRQMLEDIKKMVAAAKE